MHVGALACRSHSVTASMLTRVAGLCQLFIREGQSQAVLHGTRLEQALAQILYDRPELQTPKCAYLDTAAKITTHLMGVMKVLRTMKLEQGRARRVRTSAMRRHMTPEEWSIMNDVLSMIARDPIACDPPEAEAAEWPECFKPVESPRPDMGHSKK
eukprot:278202-Alexandrium_andersonii.AAC.1